jgi:hypothetical protein
MLLNEFLKEHAKVARQAAQLDQQNKAMVAMKNQSAREIDALKAMMKEQAAQIQKVSAQMTLLKAQPHTTASN